MVPCVVRRIVLASVLVLAAAMAAPVSAEAQSDDERLDCLIELAQDPSGEKAQECTDKILESLFPDMDDQFCDDCDPEFDPERIRSALIAFDRARALRTRLIECRDRRLNRTLTEDSGDDCETLEDFFELYVNDEGSLEARKRDDPQVSEGDDDGSQSSPGPGAASAVSVPSPQTLRGGLSVLCRPPGGGVCSVRVSARRRLFASGTATAPAGGAVTIVASSTSYGRAVLRRVGRIRARVTVTLPGGSSTLRLITLRR